MSTAFDRIDSPFSNTV